MLRQRIFTNTLLNSSGKSLVLVLQLFIIAYLIKTLGNETYGIAVLALSLAGNTNLLEAGFGLSVTKYIAEYKAKGDEKRLLEIVNTNFLVATVIALFFCLILSGINEFFLEKIFTIPSPLLLDAKNLIWVLIPFLVVEAWSVSIIRVAEGFQRYSQARAADLLKWFLRVIFVVIAVSIGYGLVGVGIAYLLSGIITLVVLYFMVFFRHSSLRLMPWISSKETFRQLFGFSVWIFLSKVFAFLSYRIDTIVIGIFLPPANLAYYQVAFKLYDVLRYGLSLISSVLVPVTSELDAMRDARRISLLFEKATKYSVLLMYPIFILALFYVDWVIRFWVGDGFETSVLLSNLFVLSLFGIAVISSGAEMMVGADRVKMLIQYNAIATAVNLILSIYLIRKIGVAGVVVGTLVGSVVIFMTYLPVMMKTFDVRPRIFLSNVIFKNTLPLLVLFCGLYFIAGYLGSIVGLAGYMLISILFLIDKEDRKMFQFARAWGSNSSGSGVREQD